MWFYVFQGANLFLSLLVLIATLTGHSIGRMTVGTIVYLCLAVAIDNLYRTGNLAIIIFFFKRRKLYIKEKNICNMC